jgi:UDP-N-acetylmuramyl pentapeptide phosphotransferase/UDP-N-acetylglucosamine-1-phosphate transferase
VQWGPLVSLLSWLADHGPIATSAFFGALVGVLVGFRWHNRKPK